MDSAALIHATLADEQETARLRAAIAARQRQIETLTLTREAVKSEVTLFERRYNAHISRHYVELDRVELEVQAYQLRLQLRRENVDAAEIESRVAACFQARRERLDTSTESAEAPADPEPPAAEPLPDTETKRLQNLYRALAKRYHPDKGLDTDTVTRREELMPLINRAYQEQDFETLERLSLGQQVSELPARTARERQAELRSEIRRLDRAASELRLDINRLKAGRSYQLKKQVETAKASGSDLLTGLAKDLERKIKANRGHLARLITLWQQRAT